MKSKIILFALLVLSVFQSNAQLPCNAAFTYVTNSAGGITFTANTPATVTQTYTWNLGNGTSGSGTTVSSTYNMPGTYTICLYVQDSSFLNPCTDSSCQTITFGGLPTCSASYNYTIDTSFGAPANAYAFMSTSTGTGLTYTWNWGDGSPNSSGANQNHTFPAAGTYNVCLYIDNGSGCTDTSCSSVSTSIGTCFADFVSVLDNSPAALPNTYIITNLSMGTGLSYIWNFGDGSANSTSASPTHTFPGAGPYVVCLTISSSTTGCADSTCLSVGGGSTLPCNASFQLFPDTTGASPHTYIGINSSTGSGLQYTWYWGDGSSSTGAYPSHTYASAGTYNICLVVMGSGCVDSMCSSYLLNKTSSMVTVNIQAPAGLLNVQKDVANIYPNPADNQLFIKGNSKSYNVDIYTISGVKVLSTTTHANKAINIQSLPVNMYMLKAVDENGKSSYAKFIKQ